MKPGTMLSITCPRCGLAHRLILRKNTETGELFCGCQNWPVCKYTRPLTEDLWMRLMGRKGLFGNDE